MEVDTLEIDNNTVVYTILSKCPKSLEIFLKYGFEPMRDPVQRETMTKQVTLWQACQLHSVAFNELVQDLRNICPDE